MEEKYLINIEGTMETEGDVDTVSLLTRGSFEHCDNSFFITYRETMATGYEGNTTTVKVDSDNCVSMLRGGTAPSTLVIELGRRHVCHYDSGAASLSLGVAADEINNCLTDKGGEITFSYMLDTGNMHLSRNKVKITVQEAN